MSIDEQGSKNDEVFFLGSPIVIPCSIIIGLERNIDSRTKSPLWRGEKLLKRACPVLWPRGVLKGREVLKLMRNRFKLPTPLAFALLRHSPRGETFSQ